MSIYTDRPLRVADAPEVIACTEGGVDHDFRPVTYHPYGPQHAHTSWVCVWCSGVACGDYGDHDPCIEIYHHRSAHRTRTGVTWPIGGTRP